MTHFPVSPLGPAAKRRHNIRRFLEAISMTWSEAFCLPGRARYLEASLHENVGRNSAARSATMRIRTTLARERWVISRSARI